MSQKLDLQTTKNELETGIRSGKLHAVRAQLAALDPEKLPRSHYSLFASFARRAGYPSWALRLLNPVVRPQDYEGPAQSPATPAEIASYALALSAIGALSEARKLVGLLETVNTPETLQACAYVSIWGWEYASAVKYLKRYLDLPDLSEFQITLAKVNLASSHEFAGHSRKAQELVKEIVPPAKKMGWHLLERDSLLLSGQLKISGSKFAEARTILNEAMELSKRKGLDELLVEKWLTVLQLREHPSEPSGLETMELLKRKAAATRRWEIARDCDYHCALVMRDHETLNKLYFGTPFPSFRKRLLAEAKDFWAPSSQYVWAPHGASDGPLIDLDSGRIESATDIVLEDNLCMKLLRLLSSDFYRPFKSGCLFSELHPDKNYDVSNSSHTVANVILRLRKFLRDADLPLSVQCINQMYSLQALSPVQLRISHPDASRESVDQQILKALRNRWPYQVFTSKQAADVLGVSTREARLLMNRLASENRLVAMGETKSRLYRVAPKSAKKSETTPEPSLRKSKSAA